MSDYTPDRWVVLELTSEKLGTIRKIFAGWYGGYLGSDEWKLNSGIVATRIDDEGHYEFDGQSGSVYHCHVSDHGMSGYMAQILTGWRTKYPHIDFKEIELDEIVET
jgi:hypothetical protein